MNRFHLLALSSVVALASSGCIVQTTTNQTPGTVEWDWTIMGGTAPSQCTATASANITITLSRGGSNVGTYTSACANFATFVDGLQPGTYTWTAKLVDSGGTARTTTASNTVTVYSNQREIVPVDFPSTSFF